MCICACVDCKQSCIAATTDAKRRQPRPMPANTFLHTSIWLFLLQSHTSGSHGIFNAVCLVMWLHFNVYFHLLVAMSIFFLLSLLAFRRLSAVSLYIVQYVCVSLTYTCWFGVHHLPIKIYQKCEAHWCNIACVCCCQKSVNELQEGFVNWKLVHLHFLPNFFVQVRSIFVSPANFLCFFFFLLGAIVTLDKLAKVAFRLGRRATERGFRFFLQHRTFTLLRTYLAVVTLHSQWALLYVCTPIWLRVVVVCVAANCLRKELNFDILI